MDYFSNMNGSKNIVCWKEVKMCADLQYSWIIIEWKLCSNMQDHFLSRITRNKFNNMQFSSFIHVKSTCSSSSSCILTIPPLTLLFFLFCLILSLFLWEAQSLSLWFLPVDYKEHKEHKSYVLLQCHAFLLAVMLSAMMIIHWPLKL